jgi:GTPase
VAEFRCGTIALVGRPNVGKSTLFNALVGEHLSITAPKPHTTRYRIMGVRTRADAQFVFIDSPGFEQQQKDALSRMLKRSVEAALTQADVIGWVVEAGRIQASDAAVFERLPRKAQTVLIANKVDRIADKATLLPWLEQTTARFSPSAIVPVSARSGAQLDVLLDCLRALLPLGEALYAEDEITDRNERFFAAELLREQLFQQVQQEVPFGAGVAIESFREQGGVRDIHATIYVAKDSHKAIVIGAGGARLKSIGTLARRAMERLFDARVHLETWVKVKPNWTQDASILKQLGLHEH